MTEPVTPAAERTAKAVGSISVVLKLGFVVGLVFALVAVYMSFRPA
jgi:hypothetical protein